jgi:hypothetical protein
MPTTHWWDLEDDCEPLRHVHLTDYVVAELPEPPIVRMNDWRDMRWPDRPHP